MTDSDARPSAGTLKVSTNWRPVSPHPREQCQQRTAIARTRSDAVPNHAARPVHPAVPCPPINDPSDVDVGGQHQRRQPSRCPWRALTCPQLPLTALRTSAWGSSARHPNTSVGVAGFSATALRTPDRGSSARHPNTSVGVAGFSATALRTPDRGSSARHPNTSVGVAGFSATALRTPDRGSSAKRSNTAGRIVAVHRRRIASEGGSRSTGRALANVHRPTTP